MATLIQSDGNIEDVFPKNAGRGYQLKELYDLLDCDTIEALFLPDEDRYMIFDGEGKFKSDIIVNEEATQRLRDNFGGTDFIAGHAIFCTNKEFK